MIGLILVMSVLTQTQGAGGGAGYLYAGGPPGNVGAMLGKDVSIAWGQNLYDQRCHLVWKSATQQIEADCPVHLPNATIDNLTSTNVNLGTVSLSQVSSNSANISGQLAAGSVVTGPLAAGSVSAQGLTLAQQTLPTCSSANAGSVAYGQDGLFYGCGTGGWVALTNPTPKPALATQQATFTPPTSLGVLGAGNTSSWIVTAASVPAGADCVITCPQALVGKVVWSCDAPAAGQLRAIGTGTTALSVTLPANQSCSMRALWTDSPPAIRTP